jgi:hypothetical protein
MMPPSEAMIQKWQERAEKAEAEVARLREALEAVLSGVEKDLWNQANELILIASLSGEHSEGGFTEGLEKARAALTTSADGWLTRHDEEVRREERERWQQVPNEVKLFQFVHDCIRAYRHEEPPYDSREVEFVAWCLERWTRRRKAVKGGEE